MMVDGKGVSGRVRPGSSRIRTFLFDFGGVIAEEGFREGLLAIARREGLDPKAFVQAAKDAVYDSGYVIGKANEAEFWELLRARTGIQGRDAELTEEILQRFVVRPWMIDLVRSLRRQGYTTAILSDQTDWLDRLERKAHFFSEFDVVFNSYHLGKGKRDPSLFDDVVMALRLSAGEALFVDDDPGNVDRARARGLRAVLYRDREGLLRTFQDLGVLR